MKTRSFRGYMYNGGSLVYVGVPPVLRTPPNAPVLYYVPKFATIIDKKSVLITFTIIKPPRNYARWGMLRIMTNIYRSNVRKRILTCAKLTHLTLGQPRKILLWQSPLLFARRVFNIYIIYNYK